MEKLILENKWLFKQFTLINRTAMSVYGAVQGGEGQNFYLCYTEFENGVFGWVKESRSFETAIEIYDLYTANDGWDMVNQLVDVFGDYLTEITFEEIAKWEMELAEVEL